MRRPLVRPLCAGLALALALVVLFAAALAQGSAGMGLREALGHLLSDDNSQAAFILRHLRLPRALVAALVGASLGMAGLIVQTVLRNPLGDPGLIGVTAGAAFGVALAFAGFAAQTALLLGSGLAGGTLAAAVTLMLSRPGGWKPLQVTLAGMSVAVFFTAATSAVMILHGTALRALYFWMIGGFVNRTWAEVQGLWPFALAGLALGLLLARRLDLMAFDDATAASLGGRPALWRLQFLALSVVLTAASVAAAGPIGFVGFAVPHLMRGLAGRRAAQSHRVLMPLAALGGAVMTLAADALARAPFIDKQMPAGIITALAGGLLLLAMLRRMRAAG